MSSKDSKQAKQQKEEVINISKMDLHKLNSIKQQIEHEIDILEQSLLDLHNAKTRFNGCVETVQNFDTLPTENKLLIPLTPSLYVPGKVVNNDEFLLDIGASYYMERNRAQTGDYFCRKVEFLSKQITLIAKTLQEKKALRSVLAQQQMVAEGTAVQAPRAAATKASN